MPALFLCMEQFLPSGTLFHPENPQIQTSAKCEEGKLPSGMD